MKTTAGSIAGLLALALFGTATRAQEVSNPVQTEDKTEATTTTPVQAPATPGVSGVRIVRLSQVKGDVQLNRKTDQGFETAFANLPIVQNQRLQTHQGVAEIEFEDNTTLRITTDTLIEFPTLQRTATGTTITNVKILSGTLYASLANTKGNEFTVTVGNDKITLMPSSHIRIDVGTPTSKLSVFNGSADLIDASGTTTVGKKKAFTFDATTQAPPVVAKNGEPGPFDDWDKTSMEYHNLRSVPAAYAGSSSYLYGINDLNYYGSFANIGGCGSMWRPYLASAAWDPFANGVWAWYPGAGYSWVSPYPWGWTPFHSGSWSYCAGSGWGWRPGGQWNGLQNQAMLQSQQSQPLALNSNRPVRCESCPKPPLPPTTGHSTLVVVNTKPLAVSRLNQSSDSFEFRKDSAGLGVPRDSLGKLNKISAGVEQHGFVSKPVYVTNRVEASHTAEGLNRSNSNNASTHNTQVSRTPNSPGSVSSASHASSSSSGWSGGSRASSPGPSSMPSAPAAAPSAPAHH